MVEQLINSLIVQYGNGFVVTYNPCTQGSSMIFVDFPIIYIGFAPLLSVITNIDKKNTHDHFLLKATRAKLQN